MPRDGLDWEGRDDFTMKDNEAVLLIPIEEKYGDNEIYTARIENGKVVFEDEDFDRTKEEVQKELKRQKRILHDRISHIEYFEAKIKILEERAKNA